MSHDEQVAAEQAARWNGPSGRAWADNQDLLDRLYEPFEKLLVRYVDDASGQQVLDVGCGTGSTTLAVGRVSGGRAVGVDISEPMIAVARRRASSADVSADFVTADMQTHEFTDTRFDTIVSRFGVMFFSDPVAAFRNLHRATTGSGNLRMIVWRNPDDRDIMVAAENATASLLPDLPPRPPSVPATPGQFAFADPDLVSPIFRESGWRDVSIDPLDVDLSMPAGDMLRYVTTFGRVGVQLPTVDETVRAQVIERVSETFTGFADGADVRYTAACWLVSAQA
ncbi:methyltransferase family protein [Williamsia limnetica]|uniref:Methyltransferase family protein n=1 Tax=Williamsia limnetica TaxID=882452 RepID=A0A318RRF0_WILLI|nr:class I SAM-dependent methyltransferase [Williamsia limnetica]PYE19504.1 methyltransferase family protein [Williamsia limnetica]